MTDLELTLENFNEQDRKTLLSLLRNLRKLADLTDGPFVKNTQVHQKSVTMHWAWDKPINVMDDSNHVITVLEQSPFILAHILNKLLNVQPEDELPDSTDED